ncbi:5-oxoprolinase subunit B family protein [Kineococcus sp. SYSU DK003]|uniref:5-oxoprolinase subunit B family protein n=1 Tax=Kineococcus sp. SYSU DK003 TaxID=3383124 RepID=UPI003D7DA6E4
MELPAELGDGLRLRLYPFGDAAVMAEVAGGSADSRPRAAAAVRSALLADLPVGVLDLVAGIESVLVEFDADRVDHEVVEVGLRAALALRLDGVLHGAGTGTTLDVPVVFGGEFGPDLDDVARELGLDPEEVVARFTARPLTVTLLGAAMAPMLEGADFPAPVARMSMPRTSVPGGSVMVAGNATIITPFPGPTGWRVIGRTPLAVCDITRDPATSYAAGDALHFRPLPPQDWPALDGRFLGAA